MTKSRFSLAQYAVIFYICIQKKNPFYADQGTFPYGDQP